MMGENTDTGTTALEAKRPPVQLGESFGDHAPGRNIVMDEVKAALALVAGVELSNNVSFPPHDAAYLKESYEAAMGKMPDSENVFDAKTDAPVTQQEYTPV